METASTFPVLKPYLDLFQRAPPATTPKKKNARLEADKSRFQKDIGAIDTVEKLR